MTQFSLRFLATLWHSLTPLDCVAYSVWESNLAVPQGSMKHHSYTARPA